MRFILQTDGNVDEYKRAWTDGLVLRVGTDVRALVEIMFIVAAMLSSTLISSLVVSKCLWIFFVCSLQAFGFFRALPAPIGVKSCKANFGWEVGVTWLRGWPIMPQLHL